MYNSYKFHHTGQKCLISQSGRRSGVVTHPNSPDPYQTNKNCKYIITAPKGTIIRYRFVYLDIEEAPNCEYDSLKIYDGNEAGNNPTVHCGSKVLQDIFYLTGNEMVMRFVSDRQTTGRGFKFLWDAVPASSVNTGSRLLK